MLAIKIYDEQAKRKPVETVEYWISIQDELECRGPPSWADAISY